MENYEMPIVDRYPNDAGFVKLRLDTSTLMKRIQEYLSGKTRLYSQDENGVITSNLLEIGGRLVNDKGVAGIMASVDMRVNPHTVTGNFNEEQYSNYLYHTRRELAFIVVQNGPVWEIEDYNMKKIIDDIMGLVGPFMSRLIDNGERDSYQPKISVTDSNRFGNSSQGILKN